MSALGRKPSRQAALGADLNVIFVSAPVSGSSAPHPKETTMQLKTHFKLTEVVSAILHISREVANLRDVDAAQVMAMTLRVLE